MPSVGQLEGSKWKGWALYQGSDRCLVSVETFPLLYVCSSTVQGEKHLCFSKIAETGFSLLFGVCVKTPGTNTGHHTHHF